MVKQYYPEYTDGPGAEMVEYEYGEWVSADDFDELESELGELQDKYAALVKKLGEIYQES